MDVYLIRHTSVNVPKGTCYGWTDVPVADTFEQEAAQTKQRLNGISFDRVFSSPLTRARKLAAFCGFDSPDVDERLKEMNMGDWEMKQYDSIKDNNLQRWYDDYIHTKTTNGESFEDFYRRVSGFLDWLKTQNLSRVAIFAHGGVLMCAGIYAGLYKMEECFDHNPDYGEVIRVSL